MGSLGRFKTLIARYLGSHSVVATRNYQARINPCDRFGSGFKVSFAAGLAEAGFSPTIAAKDFGLTT
jgi:hypothetical protein